ncbi:putative PEP-CTERM system TPR-repeat lipoprotein [Salinisphaera dokdonensis CL-ES53]|uniref:PEP-CTERM system TPR-repeat lipoprotein n=2 Tax=Salinisphaera TaxID=180541 RepID=A0ABV2B4B4_9GAMM
MSGMLRRHNYLIFMVLAACFAIAGCGFTESIDSRMEKASADVEAGRYRAAEIHLKNVLQKEPSHGGARLLLGRLSLATTQYEDAVEHLQRASDLGVSAQEINRPLAKALIGAGRFDQALTRLADSPDGAEILALRGDALLGLDRDEEAAAAFAEALELQADYPAGLVGQARLAQRSGDDARAGELLTRALQVSPDFLPALEARGGLAYSDGRCADAINDFEHVVGLPVTEVSRVQRFVARAFLADCQLQLQEFGPAEENVAILIKEGPDNPYANYLQSLVSIRHKDYETATTHLQRLLKLAPQNPRGLTLLASVKMAQGEYQLAEVYLNETLARTPGNRSALRMLASLQVKQGRAQIAVERLQDALAASPNDPQIRAMLAEALVSAGDSESALQFALGESDQQINGAWSIGLAARMVDAGNSEAATALLDAVDGSDGADGQSTAQLRVALAIKEGKIDQAVTQAEALAAKNPGSPAMKRLLATAYVAAARLDEAQHVLEAGLAENLQDASFQLALGLLAMRQGDFDRARTQLESLLDGADPNAHPNALLAMAKLEGVQGNEGAALQWLEKAYESRPDDRFIAVALSRAYLAAGLSGKAVNVTSKLADGQPDDAEMRHLNGVTLITADRIDEGIEDLARAVQIEPESRSYRMDLARAQLAANRLDAAREQLTNVHDRFPDYAPAITSLAMTQLRQGDVDTAMATADELARNPEGKVAAEVLKGSIHSAQGQFAAAAKAYERARNLKPSQALTFKVFEARRRSGDEAAGEALKEWLTAHSSDAQVRLVYAQWLESAKRTAQAANAYETVLASEPENPAALNNLALLYAETNSERALKLAERAHALAPGNPAITDTLGWIELRSGDRSRGLALIREAAQAAPGLLEIQYHLAFALAGSSAEAERAEAREILGRLMASQEEGEARARANQLSQMLALPVTPTDG